MRIFPIRPMSNLDRMIDIYKILTHSHSKIKNLESDVVTISNNKALKKGRSICDMLSE